MVRVHAARVLPDFVPGLLVHAAPTTDHAVPGLGVNSKYTYLDVNHIAIVYC